MTKMPTRLAVTFLVVDIGFLTYWLITALGILPTEWLFKDYDNPILHAWNWSFLPLDLTVSATGMAAVARSRAGIPWRPLAVVSLALTSCAGMQAVAFWTLRQDFDPWWWLPNLFLLLYPFVFLPGLLREPDTH